MCRSSSRIDSLKDVERVVVPVQLGEVGVLWSGAGQRIEGCCEIDEVGRDTCIALLVLV